MRFPGATHRICAFQYERDAQAFYRVLPKRLEKFGLEVAPDKTGILYFSRQNPSMRRRFSFLGFEFYWFLDRQGVPRVTKRTAPSRLQRACQRLTLWIKENRHLPMSKFVRQLNRRLRGHYNYYGVIGNYQALHRFYQWARTCAFKWLNRRGGNRRSYTWATFDQALRMLGIATPTIHPIRRRPVYP